MPYMQCMVIMRVFGHADDLALNIFSLTDGGRVVLVALLFCNMQIVAS